MNRDGDVQLASLGRSIFQRLVPVFTSMPAVKESLSFSDMTTSAPPATMSDDDRPRLLPALG